MPASLIPAPPQTQGLSSTTFRLPVLDGSLTVPEIYDWHLHNNPGHRLFVFANDEGHVREIYWPEAVSAIHVGARLMRNRFGWTPGRSSMPVVAILAIADTITYFSMEVALLRANYVVLPISPRNSPAAVAHLLNAVGANHVLLGHEESMTKLYNAAIELFRCNFPTAPVPDASPLPLFEELYLGNVIDAAEDLPFERNSPNTIVFYTHSSGSTAFPKPIPWTNYRSSQLCLIPFFGERDLTGTIISTHTIPMFHGLGCLQIYWAASCGTILSAFEPKCNAQMPTPDALYKAARTTDCDIIYSVPAIVEAWSQNEEYVSWLATRMGVLFGGGPLNESVGRYLVDQGVSIFNLYGTTETGVMSVILPAKVGMDWEYFKISGHIKPAFLPTGDNTHELVVMSCEFHVPNIINTKMDGVDSYATSDLLVPHATKSGYYRVHGRSDDQIIHSTGEKTNPGPLESILNQDPRVQAAVMFGRGQFQAGVLIDPKPQYKFDPSDEAKLAEFRNNLWESVQKMNNFAPQHSRIFKEMIIVSMPSKPFQYTAKNTARRQAVINEYDEEIKSLYSVVAESAQPGIPAPTKWNDVTITNFVRSIVHNVMSYKVKDDDDIFQQGCDSLQATWIFNSLMRAMRETAHLDTRQMSNNFTYSHPTVSRLSSFISSLTSGKQNSTTSLDTVQMRVAAMECLVEKLSVRFPTHRSSSKAADCGEVVLVTGTTGALGCYLLSSLVSNSRVLRVYAVNRKRRPGQQELREAQRESLLDRGLDAEAILGSEKLELLGGDLNVLGFGLPSEIYKQMQKSVTQVIHNAWAVDFSLALTSFEANLVGLRNLIDFSLLSPLQAPPRFVYISSVGVFQNTSMDIPSHPEALVQAESAVGSGYAESKWVAEQIIAKAGEATGLKSVIVRVGQLSGGLNGAWNSKEWVAALVQSAIVINCFPTDERDVSWVPINTAAEVIVDFCRANIDSTEIVHLVHPRPVTWAYLASIFAFIFNIPLVSYSDWLSKLECLAIHGNSENQDVDTELLQKVHVLRLLPFFRSLSGRMHENLEALGFPRLQVARATVLSPMMADPNFPRLAEGDVRAWVGYWRSASLIPKPQ